ncbi:MAG TPA: PxKF domain-containing protein, partial [Polyangia bacterium]|nr:PxKF domain-containing protein [Polyangia bacterium]
GITVEFQGGATAGQISVVPCADPSSAPTGFKIMVGSGGQFCWDIDTSSTVSFTTPPPVIVCMHYPQVGPECPNPPDTTVAECDYRLVHDDGTGFQNVTSSLDTVNNIICGTASSLSPFAIIEPLDTTKPVFSHVPGPMVVYAGSTAGAKVTYAKPTATDAVDGVRPVTCSRASGTTFPVGKTTVTCSAADKTGNLAQVAFTVWVQYQAPADGTFFLSPIRPNGSSIFCIGRAVPVKFKLTGASAGITNLAARLVVTKIANTIHGTITDVGDEDGEDADFIFKFRPGQKIYDYRWKTRGQTPGTYQLRAELGDGVSHQVEVSLKAPH